MKIVYTEYEYEYDDPQYLHFLHDGRYGYISFDKNYPLYLKNLVKHDSLYDFILTATNDYHKPSFTVLTTKAQDYGITSDQLEELSNLRDTGFGEVVKKCINP